MATITTANNNSALNTSRRSYVAVKAFNNSDFQTYTVAMNSSYVNVGTFAPVTTDALLAPKGRVLRENGRKLYPGANPDVTKYMVGVYDSETRLSGFIDPNSPTFSIFNSDRPNYIPVNDKVAIGAPVYTAGSVTAGTYVAGGVVPLTVYYTGLTGLPYANASGSNNADIFINPNLGNVFTLDISGSVNGQYSNLTGNVNVYCSDSTTGSTTVPPAGSQISLIITDAIANAPATLVFTSQFKNAGNFLLSNTTIGKLPHATIAFASDGTRFYETSRTGLTT